MLPGGKHTATTRIPLHQTCGATPERMAVHCPAPRPGNGWRQRYYHEGHDARQAGLEAVSEELCVTYNYLLCVRARA